LKWNSELRSWNCVVLEAESSKGVGFIEGEVAGRPAQVVGLAGPTSWPNGLSIFLVDLYFTLKQNISSVGAFLVEI